MTNNYLRLKKTSDFFKLMTIPDLSTEFIFKSTRSSGPGGQNVNKVSSKVELYFDINGSQILNDWQKTRLWQKQVNKISQEGILKIDCQVDRSQLRNKELVVEKFYDLLKKAFHIEKIRRPSKPTKSAINERIKIKKVRGIVKQNRNKNIDLEE
ncbi:MAG: alternative ribosome rescue aminoacyl-tRNA hydrolase ArfB [Bacteroidota bacterium]